MVARTTIKEEVTHVLAAVSNLPVDEISESDSLKNDLLLSAAMINALAHPYTLISQSYGGRRITIIEAGKLKTVKASIDLVHKRANTTASAVKKKTAKKKATAKRQVARGA